MAKDDGCLRCSVDGAYFNGGTPVANERHFAARAIWDLHKWRQALEAQEEYAKAAILSFVIRILEGMIFRGLGPHLH